MKCAVLNYSPPVPVDWSVIVGELSLFCQHRSYQAICELDHRQMADEKVYKLFHQTRYDTQTSLALSLSPTLAFLLYLSFPLSLLLSLSISLCLALALFLYRPTCFQPFFAMCLLNSCILTNNSSRLTSLSCGSNNLYFMFYYSCDINLSDSITVHFILVSS